MKDISDIQAVGNEVAAVLLQRLAQSHMADDPEGRGISIRVARLEANVESILVTQRDMKEELRDFRKSVEERFTRIDERFDQVFARARQDLFVILGFMIAMLGVMARGFHWL